MGETCVFRNTCGPEVGPDPCCNDPDDVGCCDGGGCVTRNTCGPQEETFWDFWKVALKAGVEYSITVRRVDCEFNPFSFLYSGDSCANDFDALTEEAYGADELPPACTAGDELTGDPFYTFVPSNDGIYTLAVLRGIDSGPCPSDGNYDYVITISQDNCP